MYSLLQYLQEMHSKDGPSLPVGEQLRGREESEVLRALHRECTFSGDYSDPEVLRTEPAELRVVVATPNACLCGTCRAQSRVTAPLVLHHLWAVGLPVRLSPLSYTGPPSGTAHFPSAYFAMWLLGSLHCGLSHCYLLLLASLPLGVGV